MIDKSHCPWTKFRLNFGDSLSGRSFLKINHSIDIWIKIMCGAVFEKSYFALFVWYIWVKCKTANKNNFQLPNIPTKSWKGVSIYIDFTRGISYHLQDVGGCVEEQVGGAHHEGGGVVYLLWHKCCLFNFSSHIQWNHLLTTRKLSSLCRWTWWASRSSCSSCRWCSSS